MDKTQEYQLQEHANKWRLGGFLGALLAVMAIFVIVPALEKNFYTHLILQCCFVILILSTVYAIEGHQSILIIGLLVILPSIYFHSLSFYYQSVGYMFIAYGFSLVFTLYAVIVLMKKILRARLVHTDLIFGSLMVYLFSGILWANFYLIENILSPGSFQGAGILNLDNATFLKIYDQQFNFLYYSFATLATLGMGDITPLTHLAKSLTALEAMFGQLFVAMIIAKLVSVWWDVSDNKSLSDAG